MTSPSPMLIQRFRAASAAMADRTTPFIRDEWYCAGFSDEFGTKLLSRKLLGEQVVLYRTSAGQVVALEDRCAHRSFPLSAGRLVGDQIVCGYHGFCYDTKGDCVKVPAMDRVPKNIGVRRYPTRERGRIVWIWMGDEAMAEQSEPPVQPWMTDPECQSLTGYLHLKASYVSLHENLLDLTHIEYLHEATLGQGASGMAAAPYESQIEGSRIAIQRRVEPAELPPVFASTTGLGQIKTVTRVSRTDYISPAFEQVTATYFDGSLPERDRREFQVRTAHLMTPETRTTTHYFVDHTWNWPIVDAGLQQVMHRGLFEAFEEDVRGLGLVEASLAARQSDPTFYEVSVGSDAAAVAVRRLLLRRAQAEQERQAAAGSGQVPGGIAR